MIKIDKRIKAAIFFATLISSGVFCQESERQKAATKAIERLVNHDALTNKEIISKIEGNGKLGPYIMYIKGIYTCTKYVNSSEIHCERSYWNEKRQFFAREWHDSSLFNEIEKQYLAQQRSLKQEITE